MSSRDASENTKVFYRIFPTEAPNADHIKIDKTDRKIYVRHLQELSRNGPKDKTTFWEFETDGIFVNCDQEKLYFETAFDVVKETFKGYTGLIINYGQTKTGKSFTSSGLQFSEQEFGLAPRAIVHLLELKEKQPKNIKTCIQMSCVEFGKKCVTDLLQESPNNLEFYKCRKATKVRIRCEEEALKYLYLAEGRKEYIQNNTEYLSNICSTVTTFHITTKNMDLNNPQKIVSRLHIIDLAGIDTLADFQNISKSQKEVCVANITKSNFELFILHLREDIPQNIRLKHRTNALLYYLDGDFGTNNNLRFIGHLRLLSEDLLVTLSLLRFGTIIQGVKSKKKEKCFEINEEVELQHLRQKVKEYEKERYLNSVLLNEDLAKGLTDERVQHLNRTVQDYLKNNINQITLMTVTDASLVFKTLKNICNQQENDIKKLQYEKQMLTARSDASLKQSEGGSKSSTRSQSGMRSRRTSRRSKDSVTNPKKQDSITSEKKIKTIVANKELKPSPEGSPSDLHGNRKARKSKSSMTRRSSVSKQKSSTTSIEKRNASAGDLLNLPLPDTVPDNQELWTNYTTQQAKQYKERIEEYKTNEKNVKDAYYELLKDVKHMQNCRAGVDNCCKELLMAQTFRKFNSKDQFDDNGLLIISFAEKKCKEQLESAKKNLVDQQEKTLKTQEELRIFLQNRRKIYKTMCEEFEKYCLEHFKVPNTETDMIETDVKPYEFDADLEKPADFEETQALVSVPKPSKRTELIKHLQEMMKKEIEKKRLNNLQKKNRRTCC